MIGNMALVNSGFLNTEEFLQKLSAIGHVPSKMFASPVLGQKSLKNISLKDAELSACWGHPHVSGNLCMHVRNNVCFTAINHKMGIPSTIQ
jgi:hypothetical protein